MAPLSITRKDLLCIVIVAICGAITFWAGRWSATPFESARPAPAPVASETRIVLVQTPAPVVAQAPKPEIPMALLPEAPKPAPTPVAKAVSPKVEQPVAHKAEPIVVVLEETPENPYRKKSAANQPGF